MKTEQFSLSCVAATTAVLVLGQLAPSAMAASQPGEMQSASQLPASSEVGLCVTLQVHRDVYRIDYPEEWVDLSAGFGSMLGQLNRANNEYALSEQSGQSIIAADASFCSRFSGYIVIAARYYRRSEERLPVFEYTMEGGGTLHFRRVIRRYVDEDIADPTLNHAPGPGGQLQYAFRLVLERRSKAILDELAGGGLVRDGSSALRSPS